MAAYFDWFLSWFSARAALRCNLRGLSALDRKLTVLWSNLEESRLELDVRERKASQMWAALETERRVTTEALAEARKLEERSQETINALRAELRTANDITLPGLVLAHKLLCSRVEADISIQAGRAVRGAITPGSEE